MSEVDLSIYLGVFLDEMEEQIQLLEQGILKLEIDCENAETVHQIFRAAHTLKGSAAAMGFENLKELTHKIENIFDLIRNDQLQVNRTIIDIIFSSIDTLKEQKSAIINGREDEVDIRLVTARLDKLCDNAITVGEVSDVKEDKAVAEETFFPSPTIDEFQRAAISNALSDNYYVHAIYIGLIDECILKSVRAYLIHNNLKEIGDVIASYPSTEEIEAEAFNGKFIFLFITKETKQSVINVINSISEIGTLHIHQVTLQNIDAFINKTDVVMTDKKQVTEPCISNEMNKGVQQTVRVDVERLEHLMNLVGELVIDQTRLTKKKNVLIDRYTNDEDVAQLNEVCTHLVQVVTELQEGMMKTRMLPIEHLFNRYPRMVRDVAHKANKEIEFLIQGKETELDRRLIEEISDPIIHLLRNAIDHGVESPEERELQGKSRKGQVELKAIHQENHIVITVSDDGKGIDPEKIKNSAIKKGLVTKQEVEQLTDKELMLLIFKSGFSTADKITDVSGRGVGMDIVRSQIEKLNGLIDIDSTVGGGTTFTLKLPLTLAIIRSLIVQLGEKEFALPLANVAEIVRLHSSEIKTIKNEQVGVIRDRVLPLVYMHELLGVKPMKLSKERLFVVVIGIAEKRVGLVVDQTIGNQDIVIKPLGKYIGTPPFISGATIMGEGDVSLILDVASIVNELGTKDKTLDQPINKTERNEKKRQFVTFKIGEEEYGIELQQVKDIIPVQPISHVISAPRSVVGMINLRGKVIPVIDTRIRFNLLEKEFTRKTRIIIVEHKNQLIGLIVDQVTEVLKVTESFIEAPPENNAKIDSRFFSGLCNMEQRIIVLVALAQVLNLETELAQLATDKTD